MLPKGVVVQEHQLSYDKLLKNTLAQSDEMTIRFINGLIGDDIPLDASVEWLDKESTTDHGSSIIADFYPRIGGRMYAIEVEQDDNGDMAIRIFRYSIGGAMYHNMTSTRKELSINLAWYSSTARRTRPRASYGTWCFSTARR